MTFMANHESNVKPIDPECKLALARPNKIHNSRCIYLPVSTDKVGCWHFIEDPGTQSDSPPCPRLLHRQRTMPHKPTG